MFISDFFAFCENHDFDGLNMVVSFWGQAIQISRIEKLQVALLKHYFDVDSQILRPCEKFACCNFRILSDGQGQGSGSVVRNHGQMSWCQGVRAQEGVRGQGSRGLVGGGGLVDDTGQGGRGQVPGVRAQGSGLCS